MSHSPCREDRHPCVSGTRIPVEGQTKAETTITQNMVDHPARGHAHELERTHVETTARPQSSDSATTTSSSRVTRLVRIVEREPDRQGDRLHERQPHRSRPRSRSTRARTATERGRRLDPSGSNSTPAASGAECCSGVIGPAATRPDCRNRWRFEQPEAGWPRSRSGRAGELHRCEGELLLAMFGEVSPDNAALRRRHRLDVCDPNIPMAPETTGRVSSPMDDQRLSGIPDKRCYPGSRIIRTCAEVRRLFPAQGDLGR